MAYFEFGLLRLYLCGSESGAGCMYLERSWLLGARFCLAVPLDLVSRRKMHVPAADSLSGASPQMQSCWWKIPGRTLKVYLHLTVVEHIREEIRLAYPTEVGGILLGCIERGQEPHVVIMDCLPVPCEHRFGRLYQLCEFDQLRLEKQVSSWKAAPGKLLYVVGSYRSHHRPGFDLAPEDLAMARECSSELGGLFILIRAARQYAAGLFLVEEGRRTPGCEILFPFEAGLLLSGRTTLPSLPSEEAGQLPAEDAVEIAGCLQPGLEPEASAEPHGAQLNNWALETQIARRDRLQPATGLPSALERESSLGYPDPRIPPRDSEPGAERSRWRWPLYAGFAALVVLGLAYLLTRTPSRGEPTLVSPAELNLQVKAEEKMLHITWNKSSPAIASADGGILSISDGTFNNELQLSPWDLHGGIISLPRIGKKVTVKLRLYTELGQAAAADAPEDSYVPEPPSAVEVEPIPPLRDELAALGVEGGESRRPSPALSDQPAEPPGPRVSQPPSPAVARREDRGTEQEPAPRTQRPSEQPGRPSPAPVAAAPQAIQERAVPENKPPVVPPPGTADTVAANSAGVPDTQAGVSPAPERPTAPKPAATPQPVPREPAPVSSAESSTSQAPATVPSTVYTPPRPAAPLRPVLVPISMSSVPSSATVRLRVYIDATGAVLGARPVSPKSTLTDLAISAVRHWSFSPARRGSQNVAADLELDVELIKDIPR